MSKNIFSPVQNAFQQELPECESMDEYLDAILPKLQAYSEPIEKEGFLNVRWLEVNEDEDFRDVMLHIFCVDHEYLISVDGNITKGTWKTLAGDQTFIFEVGGRRELYDCVFNHGDFLILKKHGNQQRRGQQKYFFLGRESFIGEKDWAEVIQSLFDISANNFKFMSYVFVVGLIIFIILYFSFA